MANKVQKANKNAKKEKDIFPKIPKQPLNNP